jgi:hypothetical protein
MTFSSWRPLASLRPSFAGSIEKISGAWKSAYQRSVAERKGMPSRGLWRSRNERVMIDTVPLRKIYGRQRESVDDHPRLLRCCRAARRAEPGRADNAGACLPFYIVLPWGHEDAYSPHPHRLLRESGEWPSSRTAERGDEFLYVPKTWCVLIQGRNRVT